ncbi:MAG: putative hemolysin [Anaerolineae bacterium]
MKTKLLTLGLLGCLLLVAGCGSPVSGAVSPEKPPPDAVIEETESPTVVEENKGVGMANPASVYCEEQGGTLDIRDTDVGQYGVCVFADGSECEEWAFFRGECGVEPDNEASPETADITEPVEEWVGVMVANPEGAQFDDYFQMIDQNGTRVGIAGFGEIGGQLVALRDTGTMVHVWGIIRHNVPDAYDSQIEVTRLEVE